MDYSKIPEGADYQTVQKYLKSFLNEKEELQERYSLIYALEQLSIIAEQHSYYPLDCNLERQVTDFLIKVMNIQKYDIIDIVLFIVVNMSLKNVMDYLLKNIQSTSPEIRKLILESCEEM